MAVADAGGGRMFPPTPTTPSPEDAGAIAVCDPASRLAAARTDRLGPGCMPLSSMTGFARADGAGEGYRWTWELRSVNGKGLDIRLRLPPGFEHLEPACASASRRAWSAATCRRR